MITEAALTGRTVLQSSGGSGISTDVLLLVGVGAAIVLALIWMLTQQGASD